MCDLVDCADQCAKMPRMAHAWLSAVTAVALAVPLVSCASSTSRQNVRIDGASSPQVAALGYYRSEIHTKVGGQLRFHCTHPGRDTSNRRCRQGFKGPLAASVKRDGSAWTVTLTQVRDGTPWQGMKYSTKMGRVLR